MASRLNLRCFVVSRKSINVLRSSDWDIALPSANSLFNPCLPSVTDELAKILANELPDELGAMGPWQGENNNAPSSNSMNGMMENQERPLPHMMQQKAQMGQMMQQGMKNSLPPSSMLSKSMDGNPGVSNSLPPSSMSLVNSMPNSGLPSIGPNPGMQVGTISKSGPELVVYYKKVRYNKISERSRACDIS